MKRRTETGIEEGIKREDNTEARKSWMDVYVCIWIWIWI